MDLHQFRFQGGNNVNIVVSDIYNWFEVEDNSYDVIISGQLFEYLEFFWLIMSEIERVLKSRGFVCIIVPSSGPRPGGDMQIVIYFMKMVLKQWQNMLI